MAYNKNIAIDIRELLIPYGNLIEEKQMLGAIKFSLQKLNEYSSCWQLLEKLYIL